MGMSRDPVQQSRNSPGKPPWRTGVSREENPAATVPCSFASPVPCHAKFFEKLPGL